MVIPDGLLTNKSTQNVRDWLLRKAVVRGIVSLPAETFSPFGANVKTSVLIARKLRAGEDAASASRVFLSEVAHVGYDASGRSAANSDLDMLRVEFLKFIAREGW
jgi:type I restriction enzyme M protein